MNIRLTEALASTRMRAYRDHENGIDLNDPIEAAAALEHRMRFEVPETAASMLDSAKGHEEMLVAWGRLSPSDRQLHRRRVAMIADALLTVDRTIERSAA